MAVAIKYAGLFQMWSYSVEHGRLLFRRTKSESAATQVDILFKDVSAMLLVACLSNIEIKEIEFSDPCLPDQLRCIEDGDSKVYQVAGDGFSGFVIGAALFVDESDREYWELSSLLDD